jgi:hypothetical protein
MALDSRWGGGDIDQVLDHGNQGQEIFLDGQMERILFLQVDRDCDKTTP